jgi:PAS domain-containing protein
MPVTYRALRMPVGVFARLFQSHGTGVALIADVDYPFCAGPMGRIVQYGTAISTRIERTVVASSPGDIAGQMLISQHRKLTDNKSMTPLDIPRPVGEVSPRLDMDLYAVLERIEAPAVVYLTGGRIWGTNQAAERLVGTSIAGMMIDEIIEQYPIRNSEGRRFSMGDLPYTRALRGEIVSQGERIEMTLPGGENYSALVTSTPLIVDGVVVAALSIWHDFRSYAQQLARETG